MSHSLSDDEELNDMIGNILKKAEKNKEKKSEKISPKNEKHHSSDEKKKESSVAFNIDPDEIIDYYKIIGATSTESQADIIRKCNEKIAQYHPDRIGKKLEQYDHDEKKKQQTKYNKQYELVREAVKFLKDPEKRKFYDSKKKTTTTNSFVNHKNSFDSYMKNKEKDIDTSEDTKKLKALGFTEKSKEMNSKHGYNPKKIGDESKLDQTKLSRRLGDLQLERDHQSVECMKKNLFENSHFNEKDFNKKFEQDNRKRDKKKYGKNDDKSIIKLEGVAAANDFGESGSNYMSIAEDGKGYEDLYVTSKEIDYMYAQIASDDDASINSMDSIDDLSEEHDNKYKNKKSYDQLLKERENDTSKFEKRQVNEWGDVRSNPFNPSCQIGELVGKSSFTENDKNDKKMKQDRVNTYKALTYKTPI
jgi:curved DNA-binding protein CbpA